MGQAHGDTGQTGAEAVRGRAMMRNERSGRGMESPCVGGWRPEPDGAVSAQAGTLRLVVHPRTPGGYARFLVLRRPGDADDGTTGRALLASGSEEDVSAAMRAAERAAARIAGA